MHFLTMINALLPQKKSPPEASPNKALTDPDWGIYREEYFNEMVAIEGKRTKRSARPFLLMLIEFEEITSASDENEIITQIVRELNRTTRNTDLKGWVRYRHTLGVAFTELRQVDGTFVRDQISRKIYKSFSAALKLDQLNKISISFQSLPAEPQESILPSSSHLRLVPAPMPSAQPGLQEEMSPEDTFAHGGDEEAAPCKERICLGFIKERWILLAGDAFLILLSILVANWVRLQHFSDLLVASGLRYLVLLVYPMTLYIFDMYNVARPFKSHETILRTTVAVVLGTCLYGFLFYIVPDWQYGRGILGIQMLFLVVMIAGWRMLYGGLFQANVTKAGALILGSGSCSTAICRLLSSPLSPYQVRGILDDDPKKVGKILGSLPILGTPDQLQQIAEQVRAKAAILATPRKNQARPIRMVLDARLRGMEVLEMPTLYERLTGRVPVNYIEDEWLLFADGFYLLSKEYVQRIKRLIDFGLSSLMLLCLAPLMALTAVAICLDSRGPVFYRQDRVGKGGRIFSVVKFRSMVEDAEAQGAQWAVKGDARVTRVGRWIRLFRIDEIPQLWNVFKGEMSLIGPRPERSNFVKKLETVIPYYAVRHSVPPGVTGWAQVNYPYGASVEDAVHKLEYDLYYIKNMSILLDLKIFLKTIGVVLLGQGAR
ncbi:sugar transferase [Desulforhabdus sp. TSK]|uniref:sugar transferase n=1 Tax=Desulforhabdus sp. TSK TaxID=2925014 RepID=UPI001FC8689E|nr:sugar transferase [Desulforhabdus sp. TSK]GKT10550.1 hypothetical protein DSTSK_38550 [Desulforhabdus sp. TSK]